MASDKAICKIEIDTLLKFDESIDFNIFIKIGEKVIKVAHEDDNKLDTIVKYKLKGLEHVYVNKDDYMKFIGEWKTKISHKFFNPETKQKDLVDSLDKSYNMLGEAFKKIGLEPVVVEMAQEISKESLKVIQKAPNIFEFFNEYRKNCSEDFLQAMMTSFTVTTMISTFAWESPAIKEKSSLASMLSHVTLDSNQIKTIKINRYKSKELPEDLREFPANLARMLAKKSHLIARETLTIVEQQYELPDGTGFPKGERHANINLLSALYIVADSFTQELIDSKFDFGRRDDILMRLGERFHIGNFKKALNSLKDVLGV